MQTTNVYQMTLDARQRASLAAARPGYNPWGLAVGVSAALALLPFSVWVAYTAAGAGWAWAMFFIVLPFPALVTAWAWAAWRLEWRRLQFGRELLALPDAPEPQAEPGAQAQAEPAELTPGYDLDGLIVSPTGEASPAALALRAECLFFVRAGLRRGNKWSRSTLAEGPGAMMRGEAWDRASKELQRLGFFRPARGGLAPAREPADILARLGAAK